jgi:hypothetical protein
VTTALRSRVFRRIWSRGGAAKRTLAIAIAVCGLFLLGPAASANAAISHVLSSTFTSTGNPHSVAVDKSSGSVYVLNNSGVVSKYDAAGVASNFSALGTNTFTVPSCATSCREIAVDNSGGPNQGVIYVSKQITAANGGINVYLPSGTAATIIKNRTDTQTTSFCGVAVDGSGNVYTAHAGNNVNNSALERYQPSSWSLNPTQTPTIIGFIGQPLGINNPCKMSVNTLGNMFVISGNAVTSANVVNRFLAGSFGGPGFPEPLETGTALATAVDLSNNDLYVDRGSEVLRFDVNGNLIESFGSGGTLAESAGIAVNPSNQVVYATNRVANNVKIFSTIVTPDATTGAAQASQTTATLNGLVETAGAGTVTDCTFEYGLSSKPYSNTVQCTPDAVGTPFTGTTAVTTNLSSLSKETLYHYRVTATNANGTTKGVDKTFTTHNVADVSTDPASSITKTSATLNGSFTGNEEATTYYFEWGPTASPYANQTAVPPGDPAPSDTGHVELSAPITGLSPSGPSSTPYHFRVAAVNLSGTTYGPDRTFFTKPIDPPTVHEVESLDVAADSAGISAQINPNGSDTIYLVEYGLQPVYDSATLASSSIGNDETDHQVNTSLIGLLPGATYHFRIVAINFGGSSHSADQTFNTPNVPSILETSATGVTQTDATLSAQVMPGFSPTTYHFEYGAGGLSSGTPESGTIGSDNVIHGAGAGLTGLAPGTPYSFRVVATNALGTTNGPVQVFTTLAKPSVPQEAQTPVRKRCRRGFVRRHGKCVKRKRRHHSRRGSRSHG